LDAVQDLTFVADLSEKKFGHIRSSHTKFLDIDKNLEGSLEFFKVSQKAFELVDKFCRENPGLTKALSRVEVPFNPINAYYCHPRKAREMSNTTYEKTRDLGTIGIVFAPFLI